MPPLMGSGIFRSVQFAVFEAAYVCRITLDCIDLDYPFVDADTRTWTVRLRPKWLCLFCRDCNC